MVKKWTVVWLAIILVVVLAACSNGGEPGSANESANEGATESAGESTGGEQPAAPAESDPYAQHFDISYLGHEFGDAEDGDWVQQQLEQKLNITISDKKIDRTNREQIELMYAAGDEPDWGWQGGDPINLHEQGVSRTIPRQLIEQYAPSYAALLNKHPQGWDVHRSKDNPDEQLALTAYAEGSEIYMMSFFRLDWLETLGIEPKGNVENIDEEGRVWITDTGFTQDELTEILRLFTEGDPDGNGQKDTLGMSGPGTHASNFFWTWLDIAGYYGFGDQNVEENGKTTEWYASSKYKDFLKYAHSLYEAGYVDPETVVLNTNQFWEKGGAGRFGYFLSPYSYLGHEPAANRLPDILRNNQPEAKLLITPPAGNKPIFLQPYTSNLAIISKNVSDEKLIRILQWFEYMYFDLEASVYTRFGQEGVNFTWSGEPYRSEVRFIENSPKVEQYNANMIATMETLTWSQNAIKNKAYEYANSEAYKKNIIWPHRVDFLNQTNYNAVRSEYGAAVDTIATEFRFNAIAGAVDIDKEWDNYLQQLDAAGLQHLLEEINKMPLAEDFVK